MLGGNVGHAEKHHIRGDEFRKQRLSQADLTDERTIVMTMPGLQPHTAEKPGQAGALH